MGTKTDIALQNELVADAFKKYEPKVRALCVQKLNGHFDWVDDCVSDAFCALLDAVQAGVKINHYQAWLYSTVNNIIMDRFRELRKKKAVDIKLIAEENEAYNLSYNYDYDDCLFKDGDLEKTISEIENRLTDYERRLFNDIYKHKKTIAQIAIEQDITESNARKRKLRLKNKIIKLSKNALEKFFEEI